MKKLKWVSVSLSAACMLLGLCLVVWPGLSLALICRLVGALAMGVGIMRIIHYFLWDDFPPLFRFEFTTGLFEAVAGLVLMYHAQAVLGVLHILMGFFVVIESTFKLQMSLEDRREGRRVWVLEMIAAVACLVLGLVMIFMPAASMHMMAVLLGVSLVVSGADQLIFALNAAKLLKDL